MFSGLVALRQELEAFIEQTTPVLPATEEERDTQPTLSFQRVLQRAVFHVQSSGRSEVTGANVLVAIFSEQESQAAYLLRKHEVSRLDVVNFISHGTRKDEPSQSSDNSGSQPGNEEQAGGEERMENFTTNLNQLARVGGIDPLIGREKELERAIQVLCRRRKNNPLLVGESGVGKNRDRRRPCLAYCAGRCAGSDGRLHYLLARHWLFAGRDQISWRF